MKHFFSCLLLTALLGSMAPQSAHAQCSYTAKQGGLFSAASTWTLKSNGGGACAPAPTSGTDAIITISGFDVVLDVPYVVGRDGSITIARQGSLIGGTTLTVGDGTSNRASTRLIIEPGSTVRVAQLTVEKGTVLINEQLNANTPTTLTTDCNLVLSNALITDNSRAIINGSIDVSRGSANNELCGTGSVRIMGCVFGGNGAVRKLAENCASSLLTTICAQLSPAAGCPGPVAANNANQQACDALVPVCRPLPVELVLFTASLTARQGVALHWVTASEKNSQHFIIERSADGTTFDALRTVAAAGTTLARTTYDQTDEQPLFGTSYYRLHQVDTDGTAAFSPVQAIRLGTASAERLAVYPGPEAQQWVVSSALAGGPASVRVYDALGRSQGVAAVADARQPGRWTLDLRALPTGLYVVRLVSAAGSFSQRIAQ